MLQKQNNATARSRDLGARCRRTREAAGLSAADLAIAMAIPDQQLAAFEAGLGRFPEVFLVPYLTHCGLRCQEMTPFLELARAADSGYHVTPFTSRFPDELPALTRHESTASSAVEYATHRIPALLQTPGYTRALLDASGIEPEVADECVARRGLRQQQIPLDEFTFFIGERVLHLGMTTEQLTRLAEVKTTIRIVPDEQFLQVGTLYSFRLLNYPDHDPVAIEELLVALVFVDSPRALERYAEVTERLDQMALSADQSRQLVLDSRH